MDKILIQDILRQYEKKLFKKEQEIEEKRLQLLDQYKDLKSNLDTVQKVGTEAVQKILQHPEKKEKIQKSLKEKLEILEKEKKEILKKHHIPEDYLAIKYDCELCKDTGKIFKNGIFSHCPCLKQQIINMNYNSSNLDLLEEENFNTFNLEYYSKESNEKKYRTGVSPYENMEEILNLSKDFVKNFDKSKQSLLFTGNTGLGKTFLSNAISKALLDKGYTVFYQKAPEMLDRLMLVKYDNPNEYIALKNSILNSDLLVIDDLTEKTTDSKNIELFTIIDTRLNKKKPTIISTNLMVEDLPLVFEARIVSRIVGNYTIKRFYGNDIRLMKKKMRKNDKQ